MSDDVQALSLFLSDSLNDLGLPDRSNVQWTEWSVQASLQKNGGSDMDIANKLLEKLRQLPQNDKLMDEQRSFDGMRTWNDCRIYFPPWVSSEDLENKPLETKLDILCFIATTIQSRMIGQRSAPAAAAQNTTNRPPKTAPRSQFKVADPTEVLKIPGHFTQEQKDLVLECFKGLKEDYNKRIVGMRQRLDILKTDFQVDQLQLPQLDSKELAVALLESMELTDEESLLRHFSQPHSIGHHCVDVRDTASPAGSTNALLVANISVEDRGGRPDDGASRITMPEWSSSIGSDQAVTPKSTAAALSMNKSSRNNNKSKHHSHNKATKGDKSGRI